MKKKRTLYRTIVDGQDYIRFALRVPPNLYSKIRKEAEDRKVSINSLIIDFINIQFDWR